VPCLPITLAAQRVTSSCDFLTSTMMGHVRQAEGVRHLEHGLRAAHASLEAAALSQPLCICLGDLQHRQGQCLPVARLYTTRTLRLSGHPAFSCCFAPSCVPKAVCFCCARRHRHPQL
jgi:hypothetical protein